MVPAHLKSTIQMLQRAFPGGLNENEYFQTLRELYPHMADENLALVMADFSQREIGRVMNDILRVGNGMNFTVDLESELRKRLSNAGFDDWLADAQ